MHLRILLFSVLVFVSLGSIEPKRYGGSRGSSKPSGSSRPSHSNGGGSTSWGRGGSSKPTNAWGTNAGASHTFLQHEGGGSRRPNQHSGSAGSNRGSSATRPFATVPAPVITKRPPTQNYGHPVNNYGNSHNRPFGTVPTPRPTLSSFGRPLTRRPPLHSGHFNSSTKQPAYNPFYNTNDRHSSNQGRPTTQRPPLNTGHFNSSIRQPAYNPYFNTISSRLPTNQGRPITQRPPAPRPPSGNFNSTRQPPFNPYFNNSRLPPNQDISRHPIGSLNNAPPNSGSYADAPAPYLPNQGVHLLPYPVSQTGSGRPSLPFVPVPQPFPYGNGGSLPPYGNTGHVGIQSHQLPPTYPGSTGYYPQQPSMYPQMPHPIGISGSHVGGSYGQTPSHTVVVPGQTSSGSSTGQIFKEAIIHAGVNSAVWKLTNPSYHQDSFGHHSYIPSSQTNPAQPNTQIITNNYYNGVPGSPGAVNETPANNGLPGGIPGPAWAPNPGYPIALGETSNTGIPSGTYPNGTPNNHPGQSGGVIDPNASAGGLQFPSISPGIIPNYNFGSSGTTAKPESNTKLKPTPDPNKFLWRITEKLFDLDENNAFKFITINMQRMSTLNLTNLTSIPDSADQPLLTVDPEAYTIPTIGAAHALYKASTEENATTATDRRKEESLLIDLIMQTNVMTAAMNFLATNNYVGKEYFDQKDSLKQLWFTPYDGSSSGFKRVFEGQAMGATGFIGIQDWIAFVVQEKAKRANYLGFIQRLDLGGKAAIIKLDFKINEILKPETAIFVGTSPELEMALYTICYYTRPSDYCVVSLGGIKFSIYTHTYRYFGKDVIDLALPIISPAKL